MVGPDGERWSNAVSQAGEASGGAKLFQAGRDITVLEVRSAPAPAMESVPVPPGAGRVSAAPGVFVGRDAELARLEAAATRVPGRTAVVAVHGPAGVGKSTLAARYVELHQARFAPVWWITAGSAAELDTGLAELAVALVPQVAHSTTGQGVESAIRWLASHDGWLLVLDGLAAPDAATRLVQRVRTGTVVVTSRLAGPWRGAASVPVGVLPPDEAVELLSRLVREEWPEADLTGARALCARLGWLPSAIDQAGAHLLRTRVTPLVHLDRLATFPARFFTTPRPDDEVPLLVRDFDAAVDPEVRCRIAWELAGVGTPPAVAALKALRPRYEVERLAIREALEA